MKQVLVTLFFLSFFVMGLTQDSLSQNCPDIKLIPHKNTKLVVYESPDSNAVQFTKDVLGKSAVYRVHLRMNLAKIDLGQKGITILFADGTKLEKPEETVDVNNLGDKFEFTATLTLSPEELTMFQKKKIASFLLFIHQKDLSAEEGERCKSYASCIVKK